MLLIECRRGCRKIGAAKSDNRAHGILKRQNVASGTEIIGELLGRRQFFSRSPVAAATPQCLANMVCRRPGPMIRSIASAIACWRTILWCRWGGRWVSAAVCELRPEAYFGLMADPQAAPDVSRLKEFLDQAFVELRSAAGVTGRSPQMGAISPRMSGARPRRRSARRWAAGDGRRRILTDFR
jgi:hypothetical protein